MNVNSLFPSKYLRAADLEGDTAFTIRDVLMELIGQDDEAAKPVLYFDEVEQGMVLNKTNAGSISTVLKSSDTDDWVGKQITIFPTQVDFGGKQVEAIRVRIRAIPAALARLPKDPSLFIDWTAFHKDRKAASITPEQLTDLCEGRDPEKMSVAELNIVWDEFRGFATRAASV